MPNLNLDLNFSDHPKFQQLESILGKRASIFPIRLWAYTGKYYPKDGVILSVSSLTLESLCLWDGRAGTLATTLERLGFTSKRRAKGKNLYDFKIHDWTEHQGHIWKLQQRNKQNIKSRWDKIHTSGIPVERTNGTRVVR